MRLWPRRPSDELMRRQGVNPETYTLTVIVAASAVVVSAGSVGLLLVLLFGG